MSPVTEEVVDPDAKLSTDPHPLHLPAEDALVDLVKGLGEVQEYCVHIVSILKALQDVLIVIKELGQAASPLSEAMLLIRQGQGYFKEVLKLLLDHPLKGFYQVRCVLYRVFWDTMYIGFLNSAWQTQINSFVEIPSLLLTKQTLLARGWNSRSSRRSSNYI